ncbi:hypothetical protein, partial [Salmonella enterica]|uniref:hypothetical protein n=1 Tax=Salmonella enterica TaxID=28901 RepID=UPI001CB7660F
RRHVIRRFPRQALPAEYCSGIRNTLLVPPTWATFPYLCTPHFEPRHKTTQNNTKQKHKLIIIF